MHISRSLLKKILEKLAISAIHKHKIEFVVVGGWINTHLEREAIYNLLEEYFVVRRNTTPIWWDLSIPLVVLGYADKQRSIWRWIAMIFKTVYSLAKNPSNKHKIILNLNCSDPNIAEYWSKIIKPEFFVLTSFKDKNQTLSKIMRNTKHENIYVWHEIKNSEFQQYKKFEIQKEQSKYKLTTPINKYTISKHVPIFIARAYAPAIVVAEYFGLTQKQILKSVAKYQTANVFSHRVYQALAQKEK